MSSQPIVAVIVQQALESLEGFAPDQQVLNSPQEIQTYCYELLKADPSHPSLHFKKLGKKYWSVQAGLNYRALDIESKIASQEGYEQLSRYAEILHKLPGFHKKGSGSN